MSRCLWKIGRTNEALERLDRTIKKLEEESSTLENLAAWASLA